MMQLISNTVTATCFIIIIIIWESHNRWSLMLLILGNIFLKIMARCGTRILWMGSQNNNEYKNWTNLITLYKKYEVFGGGGGVNHFFFENFR